MFDFLWYDLLYRPLYNLLMFFYVSSEYVIGVKDMGVAVIFLTVAIRILLLPLSVRGARSEIRLKRLEPTFDAIKERYRYDVQLQREALKKVLHKQKIGVFSNFFALIFQIVFFVVLYKIFSSGLVNPPENIMYSFNVEPGRIDPFFLGEINLIVPHQLISIAAAVIVFVNQFVRRFRTITDPVTMDKILLVGLPLMTYMMAIVLPSAKALFIGATAFFSLWLHTVKWIVIKYVVKDEELKENVENLWTN